MRAGPSFLRTSLRLAALLAVVAAPAALAGDAKLPIFRLSATEAVTIPVGGLANGGVYRARLLVPPALASGKFALRVHGSMDLDVIVHTLDGATLVSGSADGQTQNELDFTPGEHTRAVTLEAKNVSADSGTSIISISAKN